MEKLKKYIVEFIGTFFLVFTIGATVAFGADRTLVPIAIGVILMVMVYAGGYISGGHYNPAVSLAAVVRGVLPAMQWFPYALFQFLGGITAAFLVNRMSGEIIETIGLFPLSNIILGEFLFTFALCYVVLHTATSPKTNGNSYFGLAIGGTVLVGIIAVGGICQAAFNPAVAISSIILGTVCCPKVALITAVINLFAGFVAGIVYKMVAPKDCY